MKAGLVHECAKLQTDNARQGKEKRMRCGKDFIGSMIDERLVYSVLSVVEEIPAGKVATYGQIARLTGREKNARLVGKILRISQYYGQYPCHRVVNHAGRTAPGWSEQRLLLECEGVQFKENGCVDLRWYRWDV